MLLSKYHEVRAHTERLCEPLTVEDYVVSSMPDVSPTKWHLAHTSWFFETFVLAPFAAGYTALNPKYAFLFNSYYVQAGERHCRAQRGLVTRPTVREVYEYRAHVDAGMDALLRDIGDDQEHPAWALIELGNHHEQQHQELLLTDIKHVLWTNPLRPAYDDKRADEPRDPVSPMQWRTIGCGVYRTGFDGDGFSFDNERPSHRVFSEGFRIANRVVTNGEYLTFMEDGGYRRPDLWLSNGFAVVQQEKWRSPLYWEDTPDGWTEFTLRGSQPLARDEPVCHVSYYEADAFARWAGFRLPTEFEWEIAADDSMQQLFGDVWQWTQSAYVAYPGFSPAAGAVGEYNGKWMADQWVLRGSSLATPDGHSRTTYRNFFPSNARWQFTGIRLAAEP